MADAGASCRLQRIPSLFLSVSLANFAVRGYNRQCVDRSMSMQETFVGRLRGACAVLPGSHVLVAVSGGADSTALLCFF